PVRFASDNMEMLLAAALAGAGIVYGPAFVLGEHVAAGRLEQVLPDHASSALGVHAVYPSARLLGARVRIFIELLKEWFEARPNWERDMTF
ncbi:LysR substrate-binding domain-containing protein, partial [Acetobacteraceae bacterium KSS8]|nr:LysR substrate-binding domain-containing protein [Acetobacteraceae bacterium KSS8]